MRRLQNQRSRGSIDQLVERASSDMQSNPIQTLAAIATILGFLLTALTPVFTAVSGVQGFSGQASVSSAGFRFVLLVMLALACGWALGLVVDELTRIRRSSRFAAAIFLAFVWGYVLVAFCNWLFPARSAGRLIEEQAIWFTLFTATASVLGMLGARYRFHTPSPETLQERAVVLFVAPIAILGFFILFIAIKVPG